MQAECTTLSLSPPLCLSLCGHALAARGRFESDGELAWLWRCLWGPGDGVGIARPTSDDQRRLAPRFGCSGVATCCGLAPVRMIYLSIPPSWILPNFRPTKRRCRPFGSIWPMVRHVTDLWRPRRNLRNNDSSEGNRRTCRRFLARCQTTHRNRQGCF